MSEIICSFIHVCNNHPNGCGNCKWNSANALKNNLQIKNEKGKSIRYLEKNSDD